MHQSSLGSLMLIMTSKLHKLWHTPLLPFLFLATAVLMGYAAVIFESRWRTRCSTGRGRRGSWRLVRIMVGVLFVFLGARLADLALRGRLALVAQLDFYSWMFLLEMALFPRGGHPASFQEAKVQPGVELFSAILIMLGGSLYRFDTFLSAFNPAPAGPTSRRSRRWP